MKLYLLTIIVILTLWNTTVDGDITDVHKNLLEKLTSLGKRSDKQSLKSQFPIKREIAEAERAERLNRHFERMIQFVNVLGQIDNFISERTKNIVRKLNAAYDLEDNNGRSRKARAVPLESVIIS